MAKAKKKTGKQPPEGKTPAERAVPPPDNPLLRHAEADLDVLGGVEGGELGEEADVKELARLRLAALEQSRKMTESDQAAGESSEDDQRSNSQP